jgi:hypothetical protein
MRLLPTNFFSECSSTAYNGVNYHDYMQCQSRSRKRARQWKDQHQETPLDATRRHEGYTYKLFAISSDDLAYISSSAEYGDYIIRFDGCDVGLVLHQLSDNVPSYVPPGLGDCAVVGRAFFLKLGGSGSSDRERFKYDFFSEKRHRWRTNWHSGHWVNLFPGE